MPNPAFRNNQRKQGKPKGVNAKKIDEHNPVLKAFHKYSLELDEKHDRYERIIKLSRDITIEAKRIIFLLHSIDGRKSNKAQVLEEAQQRLTKVIEFNFKAIAKELIGQDPYQYRGAYSPGLQEFIEAYSFMEYFKSSDSESNGSVMSDWSDLQQKMEYEMKVGKKGSDAAIQDPTEIAEEETQKESSNEELEVQKFGFMVDPTEYILGLSDLTGELMRRCINSLGSGETDVCLETCQVLQNFYTGYISLHVQRCRELSRKIFTMRQSVLKAENVCYNVKVRGGEAAKWGAVFDGKSSDDVDEGFF